MIQAVVATVALAAVSLPVGGTAHRKTEEGNRRYEEKAYDDALRAYTAAQVAAPEAAELHYNLGNVLYRQENWTGAGEEYERAILSAPPSLAPLAAYNLGNARYREGRFEEAAQAYRRTLESRPDDAEAKRNLELALRALAEKPEPQRDEKDQRDQQDRKQQQQGQQEQQQPQDGDERRPSPGAQSGERKDGDREPKADGSPRMSREEAKNLLDSVNEQEKASLRKRAAARAEIEESGPEEDW